MGGGRPRASEAIVRAPVAHSTAVQARCANPLLVSPLEGGRDEFSWGGCWRASPSLVIPAPLSAVPAYAGMTERGAARTIASGRSVRRTPHLTSPLKGGRDELGKEWVLGRVGSCLRRNDGRGVGMTGGA